MKKILILLALVIGHCTSIKAQDFTLGADIGWATELASQGHTWKNWKGEERGCAALMKELGMNAIRLRVWVGADDASGREVNAKGQVWCTKQDVLEQALTAKSLGMDVMIDFHYSDWWADPAKQNIPKAWEKHSYKQMLKDVREHTVDVLSLLKQNGVEPRWVQVGNETSNGMLWSVEMDPVTGWEKKDAEGNTIITKTMGHWERNPKQYAGFIAAGYDAVKSIFPNTVVIVHLDNGFDNDLYNKNLDIIRDGGGRWDMIGMSLYPYWSMQAGKEPSAKKTIADCMRNIRLLGRKYDCDVMIVETGYEVDESQPWKMEAGREQLSELIRRAKNATAGRCKGVFYWEPECKPNVYKLGAFTSDGRPTSIMRAYMGEDNLCNYDRKVVELMTSEGRILVELYNETPQHRDNFLRLVESGELTGTLFHRVIKNFMIQGGDPDSKTAPQTSIDNPAPELGNSDILTADGDRSIPAEIVYPQAFHKRGALAAAREGDAENPELRSSSSQFYIVWGNSPATVGRRPYKPMLPFYSDTEQNAGTPWLDGGYTVFGEIFEGLDVVEKIQNQATDSHDRPLEDVRLLGTKVLN